MSKKHPKSLLRRVIRDLTNNRWFKAQDETWKLERESYDNDEKYKGYLDFYRGLRWAKTPSTAARYSMSSGHTDAMEGAIETLKKAFPGTEYKIETYLKHPPVEVWENLSC
jgi:hypothetical protein